MESGFKEFSSSELDVGYNYAIDACGERINREVLRVTANHAGGIFKAKREKQEKSDPRQAATEALRTHCQRNHLSMTTHRFNTYVRSIAKMMAERNPNTRAKRSRERESAELLKAAS